MKEVMRSYCITVLLGKPPRHTFAVLLKARKRSSVLWLTDRAPLYAKLMGVSVLKLPVGRKNWLLLLCALLSWGAMVLSPHYPDRATFGTMVMISCVILSMARRITQVRKDLGIWLWGASVLIWLRGMFYLCEYLAISWGWIR